MRALPLLASIALLGAILWAALDRSPGAEPGPEPALGPVDPQVREAPADPEPPDLHPAPGDAEVAPDAGRVDAPDAELPKPSGGRPMTIQANVLVELPGGQMHTGVAGHIEFELLVGSDLRTQTATVAAGRMTAEVPERARLRVDGGELTVPGMGLRRVRFDEPSGYFEPTPDTLALIGRPVPVVTLEVTAAESGASLTDVVVRRADSPGGARRADAVRGEVLTGPADAPFELPETGWNRPTWLEVEAPGRAPQRVLVDPRREGRYAAALHAAAGPVELRVTGPGRARAKALVLQRVGAEGTRPVAGRIELRPEDAHGDARIVTVEGLAAGTLAVRAVAVSSRLEDLGALRDLVAGETLLQPGAATRLDLYVPRESPDDD